MWVESPGPGQGSTFFFTIAAEAVTTPVRTRRDLAGSQPQFEGRRLLIVDDNATNRRILGAQVRGWGILPRDTGSPLEALAWIRRGDPFDAAILDMHMPEMDGLALAAEIRKERDSQALPLVMFSSLGRREAGGEELQFAAYLTKPLKPSQLFDTLAGLFAGEVEKAAVPHGGKMQLDPTMAQRLPLRILLAEDNAVNQKLALRFLQQMGYRADVAANGIEAIEALERQPYDVILMDVQMPEMDGLEASRQINKRWPRPQRPRIIGVTANAMQGDREQCLAAGMDDYITKPIRVEELVGALSQARAQAAAPVAAATPALDDAVLANLRADVGEDFIGELMTAYLEDAPELIASMKTALAQNDAESFRRAAHSLKSNSKTFGANELAEVAKSLEETGKSGKLTGVDDRLTFVEQEFERVRQELRANLQV